MRRLRHHPLFIFKRYFLQGYSYCSPFVSLFNKLSGKMEWELADEEYDYHQEIARSGFADMLHDKERNRKFDEGIQRAILRVHSRGQSSRVLDIGTGTGLLSMMAVRAGAQHVTACEAFAPMSECASRVISDNNMADRIHLIHKSSLDMTVGPDGDMLERANILVAELLDTELIGEGALHTYRHAHEHLLTADCLVVPHAANVYAQLIHSPHLSRHNTVVPITISSNIAIHTPSSITSCSGSASVHDLQLNQIQSDLFTQLSKPIRVFRFDFSRGLQLPLNDTSIVDVTATTAGVVDSVFMWWDVEMDPEGQLVISCAPSWAHPSIMDMGWRDHWLQAVYYPPQPVSVSKGQEVKLISHHDDYSLWFNIFNSTCEFVPMTDRPICMCGLHTACCRQRLGALNDAYRRDVYQRALSRVLRPDSVCLVVSDGSLLAFMAAHLGASKVYVLERNNLLRRICREYIHLNNLTDKVHVLDDEVESLTADHFHHKKIDAMVAEPHVMGSGLPGDDFYCWHVFSRLAHHMAPAIAILPGCVTMKAIAVEFDDLWKINSPVNNCEGFNLLSFDKLIEVSIDKSDAYLDPHPLWEYPCKALTWPIHLASFDWTISVYNQKCSETASTTAFESPGICNGVVVWTEYSFANCGTISTGVVGNCTPGNKITWDSYTKQSVHLLRYPVSVKPGETQLKCCIKFIPHNLDFSFMFDVIMASQ